MEIVRSFYRSLLASRKHFITILSYAAVIGLIFAIGGVLSRSSATASAIRFLCGTAGFICFLPIMLFIRAKTSTRSLTIFQEGISTNIGTLSAKVRWDQINVIEEGQSFILIGRRNGNAFYIPDRAFADLTKKAEFLELARRWSQSHG
jgi:ABC-type transport system involved in multi-copper enzyme maturation permease subunit